MQKKLFRTAGFTLVEIMIVVGIMGLLAAIAIPNFVRARLKSKQTICIINLRQIESAKQQWALESKGGATAIPTPADIQPYLGHGKGTLPSCPADTSGTFITSYGLNDVQTVAICLISPGVTGDNLAHRLPE